MRGPLGAAAAVDPRVDVVLARAPQAYLAVQDARGPHVTPVIFAPSGGRIWFVIGRATRKARIARRNPSSGVTLVAGHRSLVMQGSLRLLDPMLPLPPFSAATDWVGAPAAAAAFVWRNLAEMIGYARDAWAMLRGSSLPGDVLLAAFHPRGVALLQSERLAGSWGHWPAATDPYPSPRRSTGIGAHTPLDLGSFSGMSPKVAGLPDEADDVLVGWATRSGPLAMPAAWSPSSWEARMPERLLSLACAPATSPAGLVFDVADSRRPTGKRGLLIRGRGGMTGTGPYRRLSVRPERVTYWVGPRSGTVDVRPEAQHRRRVAS